MTRVFSILCSFTIAASAASAAIPSSDVSVERYQSLWENSLFTSPSEVQPINPQNHFEKFTLGGVSKFLNGYFVVLIDKQNPEDRMVIRPGEESDLKVLRVHWSNQDWKKTSVVICDGQSTGSIEFDTSILHHSKNREVGKTPNPRLVRTPK